ncbi:unnamed protein product [Gongylonema pulchrum]|uniref:Transposase n=1 Tax=Gongylonema pulchrum TaxID=637853 RepID=A0A183E1G8_9BILA|nr:unnamed protein product [Gongylonema pulchrum]VDN24813.1 unnamed protein product [Gongylonema pulchrum]
MDSLSDEVWAKLPPPPGFEKLPAQIQAKLKEIHTQRGTHAERAAKYAQLFDSLPAEQKKLLGPPMPKP